MLEDAYAKAYLPFLELLRRHPSVKVVMHYSGNLLSWIADNHREAIRILRGFVKAGRIEFLTGGFYEPILSILPEEDRVMQIQALTEYIGRLFDCAPKGMWIAERVWEPQFPEYLSAAGIEHFPLDDYHFKLSGLDDEDLTGYYVTEEKGHAVNVFPGSEKLRYYIPFRDVGEILSYFGEVRAKGGSPLLTMADDGEKFGIWPETHRHCYENGWLERFFSALEENSDWIETTTFSAYSSSFRPKGMVYLPAASYREMGEWVLPARKGLEYERALNELEKLFGEQAKGMLRGGIWRSFLSKYPESNHLQKRMLMVSATVHEALRKLAARKSRSGGKGKAPNPKQKTERSLLHELWKCQCNDAYWHGIFGGLYLPHLRSSLYRHLIAAESLAEGILDGAGSLPGEGTAKKEGPRTWVSEGDHDCDGFRDACVRTREVSAFFTERGGSLIELSLKGKRVNILDTLTRRQEAYHSRMTETTADSGEAKTIHERLTVKEQGLSNYLVYDAYTRTSLLDHFFRSDITVEALMRAGYEEAGDFVGGCYAMSVGAEDRTTAVKFSREGAASGKAMKVEKTVTLSGSRMRVDYDLEGNFSGAFGVEFNISLLGSPYASVSVPGKEMLVRERGVHDGIGKFSVRDEFLNLRLTFSFDEEISLWHYPVETVSLSEEGVERIYQGTSFLFLKRLDFNGHERLGFNMDFREAK
ncbi:MAG: DUF1926 domain-containing protein [Nitrospirae bacterium]|nr:DUF1926 domain-containing protein [Nitrospirota bacterium]